MQKRVRGIIIAAAAVLFVVVVVLGAWLFVTRRPWPTTRGTLKTKGLDAPVEILRDRSGVPHVYARSTHDLFFAQGYVQAQDRFWQMEFQRRLTAGRLSELLGSASLETDKFMRTLGFHRTAEVEFQRLPPADKAILEAYAAGVNAYVLHRKPGQLGLEFALLQLQGVKFSIEPWTPADSTAWGKIMAYSLAGNHEAEALALAVMRMAGTRGLASFFRPYRPDMPVTVNDAELRKTLGALVGLRGAADPLVGDPGVGSNNWVVAGSRTASGKPILCNDMHLGIQMPSIWYEIGLQGVRPDGSVGRSDACPYELRGLSFPGTPGVIAGHNDRIAWGHTNLGGDVQDWYIEKLNPANPDQYEVNGRWVDMDIRAETITVNKAAEPVVIRVRSTRHGPILSDRSIWADLGGFTVSPGKDFPDGVGLTAAALRWGALEPSRLIEAFFALNRASNFTEFREALSAWDIAAQNVVYADVDGNIGYQSTGRQPIRARGRGLAPVAGWTNDNEWKGFIPFEKLPSMYNPAAGFIVTANAPIVGPAYPYYLGSEYAFGERARRIRELIEAKGTGITVDDMKRIQADVYDINAAELVTYLKGLDLSADARPWERPPRGKSAAAEMEAMAKARDRLVSWDAQMRRESPEAALYGFFWMALVEETFRDQYPERDWPPEAWRVPNTLHYLLAEPDNPWWDDAGTPNVTESRDQVLARAFRKGYRAAAKKLGERFDTWQWGKVHTAVFRNQTLGSSGITPIEKIFNRGPIAAPGGVTTVDVAQWNMKKPFEVKHIVSQRAIIDLGNLGNSLSIISTGESGHPFNRHYDDFILPWRDVRYHTTNWERAQVLADSPQKLVLVPVTGR
jgi:penicillin G amidase